MLQASADLYGLPDQERFADQQLARRLLEPAEIAEAIRWLCSPAGPAAPAPSSRSTAGSPSDRAARAAYGGACLSRGR